MSLHIDAKKKTYILWGVIALVVAIFVVYMWMIRGPRIRNENEEQERFEKVYVKPTMREISSIESKLKKHESKPGVSTEDVRQTLNTYQDRVKALAKERNDLCDDLREKAGSEQPPNVCSEWEAKRKRLKEDLPKDIQRIGQEAQDAYNRQVEEWESTGARIGKEAQADFDQINTTKKKAVSLYREAGRRMGEVVQGEKAYYGYENNQCSLKRGIKSLSRVQKKFKEEYESLKKAMSRILRADGKLNPDAPDVKDIVALLNAIRSMSRDTIDTIARADIGSPPIPVGDDEKFEPDVLVAVTGDLAEKLAMPLIKGWLTARGATGCKWKTRSEAKDIEANVPKIIQGKEQGKLRIRIVTEQNSGDIFSWMNPGEGKADLVLTGRKMSNAQREVCDAVEKTDRKGIYRARVCSDALLFFRGMDIKLECLNAGTLRGRGKVYSSDDAGRMEAASIFGFAPNEGDTVASDTKSRSIDELRDLYKDRIILGTWHEDIKQSEGKDKQRKESPLRTVRGHELGYSSGLSIDSGRVASAYRRFLREYQNKGCHPSESTINANRYAYAYDIYFYRSPVPKPTAAACEDLLKWAGDAKNKTLATLVRDCGFVPAMPQEPNADDQLTNEDLPIDKLLQKLPADFGYTQDEAVWVRGTRFDIPLLYRVGDKKVAVDPTYVSGVSKALEYMKELTKGRRACLLLVGHADPQYGKKLDAGEGSWNFNDKLSRERADVIYADFFGKECPDSATLMHVTLGCSWAMPILDIDLSRTLEEQEDALGRCRRVEVFVVFPRGDVEKEDEKD